MEPHAARAALLEAKLPHRPLGVRWSAPSRRHPAPGSSYQSMRSSPRPRVESRIRSETPWQRGNGSRCACSLRIPAVPRRDSAGTRHLPSRAMRTRPASWCSLLGRGRMPVAGLREVGCLCSTLVFYNTRNLQFSFPPCLRGSTVCCSGLGAHLAGRRAHLSDPSCLRVL
jgi:hypothetical protein